MYVNMYCMPMCESLCAYEEEKIMILSKTSFTNSFIYTSYVQFVLRIFIKNKPWHKSSIDK